MYYWIPSHLIPLWHKKNHLYKDIINTTYDDIVKTLLSNWVGEGADAFEIDAKKVKANINDIYDILKLMCDTLTDCRQIFDECDKALGDYNRNPEANK